MTAAPYPVLATVELVGLATVQDVGRPEVTAIGVPRSGAWHLERYSAAVALVARDPAPTHPAVELLAGTIVLRAWTTTAAAVVGPACVLIDDGDAPLGTTLALAPGTVLTVRHTGRGPVYVALAGWHEPLVLGSSATDTFGRIGGRVLADGHALHGHGDTSEVGAFARPLRVDSSILRMIPAHGMAGPDVTDLGYAWETTTTARSGTRFAGPPAGGAGAGASRPMVVGAVQVTPAGEGIVLGPDGGLSGGYPVIGAVIRADLDLVSLLAPGDRVTLAPVDIEAAVAAFEANERALRRCVVRPHVIG